MVGGGGEMVDLARDHHPSNCLQDNRNHFDDCNVATTAKPTSTATATVSASLAKSAASKNFLSSFCINNDAITTNNTTIGFMEYDRFYRGNQMQCRQQQQQYRNHWHRCIKNDDNTKPNNNDSSGGSDWYRRRRHRRHPSHHQQHHQRKNTPIFQCNGMQKKNTAAAAGVLSRVHGIIVNFSNLSNLLILFAILSLLILNIDGINAEPQQPIKTATATTTAKLSAAAATTKTPTATEQHCEPKVLDETPPDPVSYLTVFLEYHFAIAINIGIYLYKL